MNSEEVQGVHKEGERTFTTGLRKDSCAFKHWRADI